MNGKWLCNSNIQKVLTKMTARMVSFPNCKINIGLNVINKRPDGFHNLESVFFPVQLQEALEVIENKNAGLELTWSQSGLTVPGESSENSCIRAFHLLKKDYPQMKAVKMHLHKIIPMGAGLGGGSSDAASMLKLLNELFKLDLSQQQLLYYAAELGSDCPFFINNKPSYVTGRGEMLEEIKLDLSAYKLLLVNPGIHINSSWAFSNIVPSEKLNGFRELITKPIENWQSLIENDFEKPAMIAYPELSRIKKSMLTEGAVYASMSGSGSTFYGFFDKETVPEFKFPEHYFWKWV